MHFTDVIGPFGPWQRRIFCVLLYWGIPCSFTLYNVQFIAAHVDHWCARDQLSNLTVQEWRSCCIPSGSKCDQFVHGSNETFKCNMWEFDSDNYVRNIRHEWNLVCDRSWLVSLSYTCHTIGGFLSYLPAGYFSDKYGRRRMTLIGMTTALIFGIAGYFSPNIEFFLAVRLCIGFCYGIFHAASLCLFLEAVGPGYRILLAIRFLGSWGVGIMILPGLALLTNDWRILQLITFVPFFLIAPFLTLKFVPESPRWLLTVGKYSEAKRIICDAAKLNGVNIPDLENVMKDLISTIDQEEDVSDRKKASFLDLIRMRQMRKMTLIVYLTLFIVTFIYFGFSITVGNLGGSLHMNIFILGLTESLSTVLFLLMAKYMTRRRALQINFLVTGIAFACTIPISSDLIWLRITVAMVGCTCNSIAYALLWLFQGEIFPTNLRMIGISGGMCCARLGAIFSTFMDELSRTAGKNTPVAVFGALSVLTSILFFFLPETRNTNLPDTVKQAQRLPKIRALKCDLQPNK